VTDSESGAERPAGAYAQSLFDDMLSRFVIPEVARRRIEGSFGDQELVVRFQVLLAPDVVPEVRLNAEVGGSVMVNVTRPITAGEEVTVDDIAGVSEYTPRPEDAGVPHVSGFPHRDGWSIVFEFGRGGHSNRFEFFGSEATTSSSRAKPWIVAGWRHSSITPSRPVNSSPRPSFSRAARRSSSFSTVIRTEAWRRRITHGRSSGILTHASRNSWDGWPKFDQRRGIFSGRFGLTPRTAGSSWRC
jgi:hypothetical protein